MLPLHDGQCGHQCVMIPTCFMQFLLLCHMDHPVARAARWRSILWWRAMQFAMAGGPSDGRHPSRGWQRGAEVHLEQALGPSFEHMALDRQRWGESREVFLSWCFDKFGGAQSVRRAGGEAPLPAPAGLPARHGAARL